jgi:hypothetical protein
MSKAEDEQQARLDRAREIGLFRYMLIREAADPALSRRQRGAMVRQIAAEAHTDPFGRVVTLTRWTLDGSVALSVGMIEAVLSCEVIDQSWLVATSEICVRRIPLSTRGDRRRGPLVPAVQPVLPGR